MFYVFAKETFVATLSANNSATFSTIITGTNAASFTLTADGDLTFNTAPDFSATAADNIYNIQVKAANITGTATQTIIINVLTQPTFNLATNTFTLTENAAENIRYKVDITDIIDENNTGGSYTFAVSANGDDIFTTNPAPVVSFSTNLIDSIATITNNGQTATLYFTIIPDATGTATLRIYLTDKNGVEVAMKSINIRVNEVENSPVISQDIATYIDAITDTISRKYDYEEDAAVFGGSLYFSVNNDTGADFADFVALQSSFNTDAHIAIVDSEQERLFFNTLSGGAFDTYLGVASTTTGGISNWTSVLGDFILFDSSPTAANGEQYAPGRFNLTNTDNAGYFANGPINSCLRYSFGISSANSFNDRSCNDVGGGAIDDGFFELPSGLPATTTLSATIDQDSSATEIAKLTGFDLDGDNITWSYTNSTGNGTVTFTNNSATNTGVSSTAVYYQPALGFVGTTTLDIILTDDNNNSATIAIDVTVELIAPSITLSKASITATVGIAIENIIVSNSGGAVASYSISPTLSNGLTFSTNTGTISGTPTTVDDAQWTIIATNTKGTDSATIDIIINPAAPNISLSANAVTAIVGTNIYITATNTGGAVAFYSIAPALSGGLTFSTETGTVSGAPGATTMTVAQTVQYTITATNVTDIDSATLEITIKPKVPSISLSKSSVTATVGIAITAISVSANAGAGTAASYSISPAISNGLIFDTTDGTVSGTPTTTTAGNSVEWTIIAINETGNGTATFDIIINPAAPNISLSVATFTAVVKTAISGITITNSAGEELESCSSNPTLPAGLSIAVSADKTTCEFSGTPSTTKDAQTYTITATNVTASSTDTISIKVDPQAPNISLSTTTITATARTAISDITVTNSGGTATYSISPAIANGLSFNTTDGTISGTPANAATNVVYTVTATNATNSDSATFSITVNPAAPSIELSVSTLTATARTAINDITVTNSGGTATYSISPAISNGLSFDTTNGTISGTPANAATNVVYTVTATNVTNSDSATLSITVNPAAPSIELSVSTLTATARTAINDITVTNSGGDATYSISPAIDNGLSFDTTDGTISGTPVNAATNVVYTVTATNVTNSDSATLSITVNPAAPDISLSTTTITATARSAISNITVTNSGGTATYSISPAISNNLSFATETGTISGTPANAATNVVYTITASNVSGNSTATLNITVNPAAPNISLSTTTITATARSAISDITVTNSGGDATYSISPAIDNGLSFNTADGTISGTPANAATNIVYTVTATNVTNSDSATFSITVNPAAPIISLSVSTLTATARSAISNITVTNSGGDATYSISPAIANNLSFDTTDGTISGTPANAATNIVYTVTATNVTNSDSATLSITVNPAAPIISLSVSTLTATAGTAISNITVTNSGGTATSYAISPAIDNGLSFNTADGTISGTPANAATNVVWTITASNISGNSTATLNITVNPAAPDISLSTTTITATAGRAISDITVTNSGGTATSYAISPAIANGLSFDTTDGTISGTPANAATNVVYTITASNITGNSTATLNITVNPKAPNISLSTTTITAIAGSAISNITVTNSGGDATYSISPAIDNDLSFDTTDGTISGTPANAATNVVYTIIASNVTGTDSATIEITVNPAAPDISLSTTTIVASVATAITAITVSNDGGTATYSISPALSEGLSFATNTGTISGTPSATATLQVYTITASNVTNSDSATLSITVNPAAPNISLSTTTITAIAGSAISNITVTNNGGDATYSISPAIDNGLSFNTTDGTISGTPANAATNVVWTITASNVSGNSTATLNITVNPKAPNISLSTTTITATARSAISDITVTNSGGTATSYAISPAIDNGLSFDTTDGTISGTPANAATNVVYTITASNVSGNSTATLSITVNLAAPSIELSVATVNAGIRSIDNITVINTGGTATYSISPAITNGLSFNTATGTISGTPSATATAIIYTVTATNISGTDSASVSITVSQIATAPSIEDITNTQTYFVGVAISPVVFTNAGDLAQSCASNPDLPAGLNAVVSGDSCAINGKAEATKTLTTYTITATNLFGSDTATINIAVTLAIPNISLSTTTITATARSAISNITVTNSGGDATYSISPAIDNGLSFDTTDGTISGTPANAATNVVYTITASNVSGNSTATVNITVNPAAPNISISTTTITATARSAINNITVTNSGGDATYSISPAIDNGLSFDTTDGTISGTPANAATNVVYTITASNASGNSTATLSITVNPAAPDISLSTTTITATARSAISNITVTNSGGDATYSISPAIDNALSFDTTDGTISGTPANAATNVVYTVIATNVTNSDSATLSITVNPAAPSIELSVATVNVEFNVAIDNITVINTGGTATYSISPAITNGLSFNTTTGTISGTPSATATAIIYTVTATNISGTDSASVSITVSQITIAPSIEDITNTQTYFVGVAISSVVFTNAGDLAQSCVSNPDLPAGLNAVVSGDSCAINGEAEATKTLTTYTITATNSFGSDTATINIAVTLAIPNISLSTTTITAIAGSAINNITVTNNGGDATYSISPAIANDLSFDTTDGTISGTPANAATNVVYTITASNVSGNSTATLNITVNPAAPNISLSTTTITAIAGSAISNITVTNSGGDATYSISPAIANDLSFDTTDGTISGTPANAATNVVYTITASNVSGNSTATLNITVNPAAPDISLSTTTITAIVGSAISDITVSNDGGTATYSISPTLSEGLSFATTDGTISGIPSATATLQVYTITASNVTNSDSATLSITVNPVAITFSLDVDGNQTLNATNDGLVIFKYLLNPDANNLHTTIANDAAEDRKTSAQLKAYLDNAGTILDVDGNQTLNATNDGLIIFKYLLNPDANNLHTTIANDALDSRRSTPELKAYLDTYQ